LSRFLGAVRKKVIRESSIKEVVEGASRVTSANFSEVEFHQYHKSI
jgi:hypothetical protein